MEVLALAVVGQHVWRCDVQDGKNTADACFLLRSMRMCLQGREGNRISLEWGSEAGWQCRNRWS